MIQGKLVKVKLIKIKILWRRKPCGKERTEVEITQKIGKGRGISYQKN